MRLARCAIAGAAVLMAATACTSARTPIASSAGPASPTTPVPTTSLACQVTRSDANGVPPSAIPTAEAPPVPYVQDWFGNNALWVRLPKDTGLPAQYDPTLKTLATKFPWWRTLNGKLTVTAQRLDGPTGQFQAQIGSPEEYGDIGFDPSYILWPSTGCWRLTGTVAGRSLTVTVRVVRV